MIRQVLVYPQAYAAVVPQAQIIQQNPRTFVVDIGGFTTDVLLLRGRRSTWSSRSLSRIPAA